MVWINPIVIKIVLLNNKSKARDVAEKFETEEKALELTGLPGKLADCQILKEITELFIVERPAMVRQNREEIENFSSIF